MGTPAAASRPNHPGPATKFSATHAHHGSHAGAGLPPSYVPMPGSRQKTEKAAVTTATRD